MPDSFFQSEKKRKRPSRTGSGPSSGARLDKSRGINTRSSRNGRDADEDLSSDAEGGQASGQTLDDMDFRAGRNDDGMSDEDIINENETAAEKRIRLAKGYLARVRDEIQAENQEGGFDAAEIDREIMASRLQQDVAESQGRIHLYLAKHLATPQIHFLPVPLPTSVALTSHNIYVATKRGTVNRYGLPELKRVGKSFGIARAGPSSQPEGHKGEILTIAASEDNRWIVTGGKDRLVGVWEVDGASVKWKAGIKGHKDAVTSIAFPPLDNPSNHLLSASLSRHLALHSLSTLSTIDTFFGHQDSIPSVASLKPTLAVTSGSRDRTCRWWKVEEEVQLVFRGGGRTIEKPPSPESVEEAVGAPRLDKGKGKEYFEGSIDVVCMLDNSHFVSGGDSGSICLWDIGKKKPIYTQAFAHGVAQHSAVSDATGTGGARWITALAALRGTDLFASGSWDGQIRLWALDSALRNFAPISTLPAQGFINDLSILSLPRSSVRPTQWPNHPPTPPAEEEIALQEKTNTRKRRDKQKEIMLVAAVSKEPRLGRWLTVSEGAKNGLLVAHLALDDEGRSML